MRYLFDHRKQLQSRLAKKNIFLFLDYDGTLSPIVSHPKKARISKKCKKLLRDLSGRQKFCLAVISGRSLKDVRSRVGLKDIIYSGNHGLEVSGLGAKPKKKASAAFKLAIKKIKRDLKYQLNPFRGAIVEDKGITLSIHYRMVAPGKVSGLKAVFRKAIRASGVDKKIKVREGKKVFEIRPPIDWNKGKIVLWLLKEYNFPGLQRRVTAIYIGDDKTDEDAFKALKKKGVTIFVGKPRKSSADYYLKSTNEVLKFLSFLSKKSSG